MVVLLGQAHRGTRHERAPEATLATEGQQQGLPGLYLEGRGLSQPPAGGSSGAGSLASRSVLSWSTLDCAEAIASTWPWSSVLRSAFSDVSPSIVVCRPARTWSSSLLMFV